MKEKLNKIKEIALNGDSRQVTELKCPKCHGPLRIVFYDKDNHQALSIGCAENYCVRMNFDGLVMRPSWIDELSSDITTSAKIKRQTKYEEGI